MLIIGVINKSCRVLMTIGSYTFLINLWGLSPPQSSTDSYLHYSLSVSTGSLKRCSQWQIFCLPHLFRLEFFKLINTPVRVLHVWFFCSLIFVSTNVTNPSVQNLQNQNLRMRTLQEKNQVYYVFL